MGGCQVTSGMGGMVPTATVKMMGPDGVERFCSMTGTGPVDAVYKAIDILMGVNVNLESYSLVSVTEGIEAIATTRVVITPSEQGHTTSTSTNAQTGVSKDRRFSGSGSDTDVIISSARAYITALNKLLSCNLRRRKYEEEQSVVEENNESASDAILVKLDVENSVQVV